MNEGYKYSPKSKNSCAKVLTVVLALFAILLVSIPVEKYRSLVRLAGYICATAMIYIVIRYLIDRYVYEIVPGEREGVPDLVITRYRGKRMVVVCRVGLGKPECVGLEEYIPAKRPKKAKLHNYTVDIFPKAWILWIDMDGDGGNDGNVREGVLFMPNKKMVNVICHCIEKK